MTTTPDPAPTALVGPGSKPLAEMRGLHAGLIVLAGVVASNVGNYAFHLLAAHLLGPSSYGSVVSLLTLSGLISLPLAGVQIAIARSVARHQAQGDTEGVGHVLWRGLLLSLATGAAIAAAIALLLPVIERLLDVENASAIVLTALVSIPAIVMPVAWGVAQGLQRYRLLAFSMTLGATLKTLLFLLFFLVGGRVAGAIFATLVAGAIAVVATIWPMRGVLRRGAPVFSGLRSDTIGLLPVVGGLLAITSLTSVDVVVAKSVFSNHDAGVYAGASLIGRVVLYLPAAITTVLLPKVTSRAQTNRDTTDIVGASIAVTLAVCLAMTFVYALAPDALASGILGSEFDDSGDLLPRFGLAMTLFAVLNVLLVYHLGHNSARMTLLLVGGAVAQLLGFVAFHDSGRQMLAVSIVVAALLLVLHDLFVGRALHATTSWLGAAYRLVQRARS